jgi:hypothetical protein
MCKKRIGEFVMNMSKIARSFKKTIALMLVFTVFMSLFAFNVSAAVPFTIVVESSVNTDGQAVIIAKVDYGTITGHLGAAFRLTFDSTKLSYVSSTVGTGLGWEANVAPLVIGGNVLSVNVSTMDEIKQSGHVLWTGLFNITDTSLEPGDEIGGFALQLTSFMDEEWEFPEGHAVDLSNSAVVIPDVPAEPPTSAVVTAVTGQDPWGVGANELVVNVTTNGTGTNDIYLVVYVGGQGQIPNRAIIKHSVPAGVSVNLGTGLYPSPGAQYTVFVMPFPTFDDTELAAPADGGSRLGQVNNN